MVVGVFLTSSLKTLKKDLLKKISVNYLLLLQKANRMLNVPY